MSPTIFLRSASSRPSRRTLLASAALVAPATLLPAIAAVAAEGTADPHPAWWAEAERLRAWINGPGTRLEDEESDGPFAAVCRLEDLIALTPARTLAGVRVQLALLHHVVSEVGMPNDDQVTGLANAIATLERLGGEARHV